jgi:hypothetical protein
VITKRRFQEEHKEEESKEVFMSSTPLGRTIISDKSVLAKICDHGKRAVQGAELPSLSAARGQGTRV